ncbi:MAG TPA: hypothetical protein VG105_20855 [Paraburkholderia sp.]|jgi:hypothetical protein|nr:hypothetical protein [Paraburkholderia sp.]
MDLNDTDALLSSLSTLVATNGKAMSRFSAQVMVMKQFLAAAFPNLTAAQCAEITKCA